MKLLFIGQCTFRITLTDGTVLLTDPWFKNNPVWRAVPPALGPDQVGKIDYLLSSHNHLDHIDRPSLDLARENNAMVIGSERVARRARKHGIARAVALKPGETTDQGPFVVKATPAFHPLAQDAVGFLIQAEGRRLYFSGDTRNDPRLAAFLVNAGRVDLAFLQIACAVYFGKDDGLNLRAAAELARAFKPHTVVPMHYHGRFKQADPGRLTNLLADTEIEVRAMNLGEEVELLP